MRRRALIGTEPNEPLVNGTTTSGAAAAAGAMTGFAVVAGVLLVACVALMVPAIVGAFRAADSANTAQHALESPCSKYRAFGVQGTPQGFLSTAGPAVEAMVQNQVDDTGVPGMFVAGGANGEIHHFETGMADVANAIPFTNRTLIRLLQQGRFIGAVALLKFMSESNMNGDDLLSTYIPQFASTQVIKAHDPHTPLLLNNAFTTVAGSNVVTVTTTTLAGINDGDNVTIAGVLAAVDGIPAAELNGVHTVRRPSAATPIVFTIKVATQATAGAVGVGGKFVVTIPFVKYNNALTTVAASNVVKVTTPAPHGWSTGDFVAVGKTANAAAVDGIPAAEINGNHQITVTSTTEFTFAVTTTATAGAALTGGGLQLAWVDNADVFVAAPDFVCNFNADYYTLEDPITPPIVRHVLDHSLGLAYSQMADFLCADLSFPFKYQRETLIQNRIVIQRDLAQGFDLPGKATSGVGIQAWAAAWAQVPLAFHPGAYWIEGPQASFIGALIEIGDASASVSLDSPPKARTTEQYMQETIFDPVGMEDTLFFIQDLDPRRTDLLGRMSEVYFSHTSIPVTFFFPFLAPNIDYAYAAGRPRVNALFDSGLMSTPADLLRFADMIRRGGKLRNGTRIIPETLVAELSRTQNRFYENLYPADPGNTWGYGVTVSSHGNFFGSTSVPMGDRVIHALGNFRTTLYVDFGQDTFSVAGWQGIGGANEFYAISYAYGAHLKCINPQDVDAVSLPTTSY
jgi:CubicO group peptidase (beta-lactamase class C family)